MKNKINETNFLIDLSHTIEDELITYKGLPAPIISDYLSKEESKQLYEKGTEFQIGKDLSEVGLESFSDIDSIVIRVPYSET